MSSSSSVAEEELTLTVKWSGKDYMVRLCGDDSIGELKRRICLLTSVLPKWQKLLYPKVMGSRLSNNAILLSELHLKSSLKMTMIGIHARGFQMGYKYRLSGFNTCDKSQGLRGGLGRWLYLGFGGASNQFRVALGSVFAGGKPKTSTGIQAGRKKVTCHA